MEETDDPVSSASPPSKKAKQQDGDVVELLNKEIKKTRKNKPDSELSLVGPPVPASEALKKWPSRYTYKSSSKVKMIFYFYFYVRNCFCFEDSDFIFLKFFWLF